MGLILCRAVAGIEESDEHSCNDGASKPVPVLTDYGDDPLDIDAAFFFGLLLGSMVKVFLHCYCFLSVWGRLLPPFSGYTGIELFNVLLIGFANVGCISSFSFSCQKENEAKEKTAANKTPYSQRVYLLSFSATVVPG